MSRIDQIDDQLQSDDVVDELLLSGREIVAGFAALDPALLPTLTANRSTPLE